MFGETLADWGVERTFWIRCRWGREMNTILDA